MSLSLLLPLCAVLIFAVSNSQGATFPGANSRIVFSSNQDGGWEIYSAASDGSELQQLTNNADSLADIQPSVSPDGRQIAFSSSRDGNYEIYVMDIDGSNQTRSTNSVANDFAPSWYPDGIHLAEARGDGVDSEIYRIKAGYQYAGETRLTDDSAGTAHADQYPTVTPDGLKVLWERDINSSFPFNTEIFSMNALTGDSKTNLTNNPALDFNRPSISPDGSRFAWSSNRTGLTEVLVADVADGGNVSVFTDDPDLPSLDGSSPAFSPDGNKILFASYYNDGASGSVESFYSANLDGTGLARLTASSLPISAVFSTVADWGPSTTELLAVAKSGTGDGNVSATTASSTLSSFTSASFPTSTPVTLSATAAPGSAFTGWSGETCSGLGDCSLTMNSPKNVTASFDVPAPVTITKKPRRMTRLRSAEFRFIPGAGAVTFYRCRIDRKPFTTCSSPIRYRNLKKGRHAFQVYSTLSGINGATKTHRWRIR